MMHKASYREDWLSGKDSSEFHALTSVKGDNTSARHLENINCEMGGIRTDESSVEGADEAYYTEACSAIRNFIWRRVSTLVPLILLIAYIVYVGFAVYFDPKGAIFVCCLSPLVLYVSLNKLTDNYISESAGRAVKILIKCLKPRRKVSLWIRRYLFIYFV